MSSPYLSWSLTEMWSTRNVQVANASAYRTSNHNIVGKDKKKSRDVSLPLLKFRQQILGIFYAVL